MPRSSPSTTPNPVKSRSKIAEKKSVIKAWGWWTESAPLPWIFWVTVLAISAVLRLSYLEDRPTHFDEGVNGWFITQMESRGWYDYNPENFHGPWYFYATYPLVAWLGHSNTTLRLPSAIFSLALTAILLAFASIIGRLSALLSSLTWSVSPGVVFFSRYGIHEAALALFLGFLFFALLSWRKSQRVRWLFFASLAVAGAILTKETFVINVLALAMAWGLALLYDRIWPSPSPPHSPSPPSPPRFRFWATLAGSAALVVILVELTFSNFNTRETYGWALFLESYSPWSQTAVSATGHHKEEYDLGSKYINYYWLALLLRYEWTSLASLLLAAFFWKRMNFPQRTAIMWAAGSICAYSIIPYKTPWCVLSFMPALALATGSVLATVSTQLLRPSWGIFLALTVTLSTTPQALLLNFKNHSDPDEPYVYVPTLKESTVFLNYLRAMEAQDKRVRTLPASIRPEGIYPMPWWFREYTNITYQNHPESLKSLGLAWTIVEWKDAQTFLKENYDRDWHSIKFSLRPGGPRCIAFFDTDIFCPSGVYSHPSP